MVVDLRSLLPLLVLFVTLPITSTLGSLPSNQNILLQHTTSGVVEGFADNTTISGVPLHKWLGMRFAQDTSGVNRWEPPQPVVPELGAVFNASEYGPACLQGRADGGSGTAIQSEDCLRINVIAPANASNLPVYLYAHGGGFDSGASSDVKIDGTYLAARGIVFASYNYRLSLWGFPHSSEISKSNKTQNFGLLDTRAAVEWLHANVHRFGGDPKKITLGAVMQSGDVAQPMWPTDSQLSKISSKLGCLTGDGQLDCLRKKDGSELRKVLLETGAQFQPVTDNITIWKEYVSLYTPSISFILYIKQTQAGHSTRVPLLIGTNKDEGTLIVEGESTAYLDDIAQYSKSNNLNFPHASLSILQSLYPVPSKQYPTAYNASAAIWRDAHMLCHARNLAHYRTITTITGTLNSDLSEQLQSSYYGPVWRYRWDHIASNLNSRGERIGAFHGSDIRFVMGQWRMIVLSPPYVPATEEQIKISDLMVTAWTNFVKGPRIPGWKRYDPKDPETLAILGTSTSGALAGNHTEVDAVCDYWNTLLPTFPRVFPDCGSWVC
ncbi:hypothetical protein EST38_g156 [Candolleomyces aberdarensis]|uniref:Carboxylesterase type B domain-containing protein n=1 Tax=Candolleomyces aberdarensis TaxID=2316362 RepID=A0A4V1Q5I6_9AGAR|nr:hypothetical protein EST38_g156 [Candolleomyces aberdarensis]